MDRQHVYEAIEGEREYQDVVWFPEIPTTGEIVLLEEYLARFKRHYSEDMNVFNSDVPEKCLHDLRKMAAILVRAMEHNGIRKREGISSASSIPDEVA